MKFIIALPFILFSSLGMAQNKIVESLANKVFQRQVSTVYCSYGKSEIDAVNELQSDLASASMKFYVQTKDGSGYGSRVEVSSTSIKSVSAISIVKVDSNFPFAACVTVIGTAVPAPK